MTKLLKISILLLAALALLAACNRGEPEIEDETPPPYGDETPISPEAFAFTRETLPRMDGSPSTIPLAQALAAVMLGEARGDVEHLAMFTRTTQAFRNLADGLCDILIIGEPSPLAVDEIARRDFRYDMEPIASDALVFIVSASNPVDNLTSEQVRAIYLGELTGWQQVGGHDLDIAAFQRNEEAASQVLADMLVMDWTPMADAPMQTIASMSGMYSDDTTPTAIKGFDGSVNAIGYTMYYYAVNMSMADGYKLLSIDGVHPTPDTIASGAYPFVNPYYAVISSDLPEDDNARILYNWLLSDEGQALISREGYVPAGSETAPQMRWSISTDDSKLPPYGSPYSRFSRLSDTALPALEPTEHYGPLLPYSTAVTLNDGSIHPAKYGFVAALSGIIVTDPIYDGIYRAIYSAQTYDVPLDVYSLHMNLPEDDPDFGYRTIQAACAADGSWITPFLYENIAFRENIMFLMYSNDTFDIDVYDYSGNKLYNILELDWADRISEETWPWHTITSESGGYGFIQLDDGTYALMDMMAGTIRETNFVNAFSFSEGLACVVPSGSGGLWGFVNKDLELVISAAYAREAEFIGGHAIVESPDGTQHVIDKNGKSLYSAEDGCFISNLLDGHGYALFSPASSERALPKYLTNDFEEIAFPSEALPLGPESSVSYLHNGWFSLMTEDGIWLFSAHETHALPASVQRVIDFVNGYVVFVEYDSELGGSRVGVMTTDGAIIVEPADAQAISPVIGAWAGDIPRFAVNTDTAGDDPQSFVGESYTRSEYVFVNLLAEPNIRSGLGILSFDKAAMFLFVQGADYFAWLTYDGETFISIPSMAYTYD